MSRYLLFNKPFQVLTQFTDPDGRSTLADFIDIPGVYSAGRLDYDSEGLLLLTDDGQLIHSMMNPAFKVPKTYYAQVEGDLTEEALASLRQGLTLKDGPTLPAQAEKVDSPAWLWARTPPIRERKAIPTSWLKLTITEGRNRQVRRMTAAVGYPTLRLIRARIGDLSIEGVGGGEFKEISKDNILDNGIKWKPKKGDPKAASRRKRPFKPQDQRRRRNPPRQSRSRKA